jgi:hypothetical protein
MICYENRNGLVLAYDTETQMVVIPGGGDVHLSDLGPVFEFDPEAIAAELARRGAGSVYVYVGRLASWVDGQIPGAADRARKFTHMASQARRHRKAWACVPVGRIADGSEWSDVYGAAHA